MKFAGFVITYNRPETLEKTIGIILDQTCPPELLVIIDNGSSKEAEDIVRGIGDERITYSPTKENLGPAGAAAIALKQLCNQGFEWIYWVDDDDPPKSKDTLERLMRIANGPGNGAVGGVAAVGALWDWQKGELKRLPDDALTGVLDVDASGGNQQLILNRRVVKNVGLPDARLFFGLEEIEYCLRIRKAGFRLLVDGDLMRHYRQSANRLNLNLKRHVIPQYHPHDLWRRYYSTRNYIFLMNTVFSRPDLARRESVKGLGRILGALAKGQSYALQFANLQIRGILDGYRRRMGRTVNPICSLSRYSKFSTR